MVDSTNTLKQLEHNARRMTVQQLEVFTQELAQRLVAVQQIVNKQQKKEVLHGAK